MSTTGLRTFDHSLATTQEWLRDIQEELSVPDRQDAFVITRAVLHTLRDRLTVEEAADFAAQLPMLLQGVYFHEWRPGGKPVKYRTKVEFIDAVADKLMGNYAPDKAVEAVFRVLKSRMSEGSIEDVKRILPEEIQQLWPE